MITFYYLHIHTQLTIKVKTKRTEIPRIPLPWRESIDIPIEFPNDSHSQLVFSFTLFLSHKLIYDEAFAGKKNGNSKTKNKNEVAITVSNQKIHKPVNSMYHMTDVYMLSMRETVCMIFFNYAPIYLFVFIHSHLNCQTELASFPIVALSIENLCVKIVFFFT